MKKRKVSKHSTFSITIHKYSIMSIILSVKYIKYRLIRLTLIFWRIDPRPSLELARGSTKWFFNFTLGMSLLIRLLWGMQMLSHERGIQFN